MGLIELETKDSPCPVSEDGKHKWQPPEPDTGLEICAECGAVFHLKQEEAVRFLEDQNLIPANDVEAMFMEAEAEQELEETETVNMSISQNYNEGKLGHSLLLTDLKDVVTEVVKVLEVGASKYERGNWAKSIGTEHQAQFMKDNFDSIIRHIFDYNEDLDDESGCYHEAHAIVRLAYQLAYKLRTQNYGK